MPPPEKFKCKLLTPDGDRDGWTGVILYALSTILRMVGEQKNNIYIKMTHKQTLHKTD